MTDERIVAYLLGELTEEESEQFEGECFAGEDWPAQIIPVEEDLIDAYLRDELTPEQRQRFERNYLTTEARRERVAMVAALLRHVDTFPVEDDPFVPAPPAEPTWAERLIVFWDTRTWGLRVGVAVGLITIIIGSLWLSRPHTPAARTFAILTLSVSVENNRSEGGQASNIRLPPGTDALRIFLKLPEQSTPAARYRVELMNEDGEISSPGVAGQERDSVSVEIPAAQLTRGRYAVQLFAITPDGAERRTPGVYLFNVE